MKLNLIGPFLVNHPFGTEIAFAKGLQQIGHTVVEVDPNVDRNLTGLEVDADATVVFKSCCGAEPALGRMPPKMPIVVYQPDDLRFAHIREMMLQMRQFSKLFLSFDDHGANIARIMGYKAAETLLLTADPDLYSPDDSVEKDIDVSFVGSLGDSIAHGSRRRMIEIVSREAEKRGWKTWFGEAYFDGRTPQTPVEIYRRSKVVLNHATDVGQPFGWGHGIQCRHFEVGMTRSCLLSNYVYKWKGDARYEPPFNSFRGESSLTESIEFLLGGYYKTSAKYAYDRINEYHLPIHRAKQLVDFIERNA